MKNENVNRMLQWDKIRTICFKEWNNNPLMIRLW